MDATTTPSMHSLIQQLKLRHPHLSFMEGDYFSWSPHKQTVFYTTDGDHTAELLLHELSHALLNHRTYHQDIELVAMENAAWEKAREYIETNDWLKQFSLTLTEDIVQDHLDTYREWLHARSTCPKCTATGYQSDTSSYTCPACSHRWRVNEARLCALRRYSV